MSDNRIIAILGATGAQGGGLARAILDDPHGGFVPRAITRKTSSDKAQALATSGAHVVSADLDDVDSLTAAFNGAYGVFAVTNFWEHFSGQKEFEQARNIAEAASRAGVKHVIWSTFEDTRDFIPLEDSRMPTLQGKYKVAHFDAKAEANAEFSKRGVPTTNLLTSFYWDNYIHFGLGPTKGADGVHGITFPMADRKLPGIAAEDIGPAAYGIFKAGDEYIGQTVGIAGEHLTGEEMAQAFSRKYGTQVRFNDVPADVYRSFPFAGADDMGNMFQFKRDFNDAYVGARSLDVSRALHPGMQTFQQWLDKHAHEMTVA